MTSTSSGSPSATPSSGSPSARPEPAGDRSTARARLGSWAEGVAAAWYEERGYRVLARNWRCPAGELDLVVGRPARGEPIVFVEVKARRGTSFGTAEESVTATKQRRCRRAAAAWLAATRSSGGPAAAVLGPGRPVRFDVVAVTPRPGAPPVTRVITGAF